MRKLFGIFSAMLFSLTMQASISTTDLDLSSLSGFYDGNATIKGTTITADAWNGGQLKDINYDATGYDYLLLDVADHAQKVLLKVIYSDDSSDQATMNTNYNTVALYLSKKSIKTIQVINWSGTDDVTIEVNKISLGKAFRDSEEVTLCNESHEFTDWVWAERLQIEASKFNNVFVGDMLQVYVTTNATNGDHQISIQVDTDNDYLAFSQDIETNDEESQDLVFKFPIFAQADLDRIQTKGGIHISGKNMTCTKVSVIHHDVLWSGSAPATWDADVTVPASSFSSVTVGDILKIRLSEAVSGSQVEVLKGNWGNFTPQLWFTFNSAPESLPAIVSFVCNASTVDDLKANGLIARGADYTMTDIYIDAETATTTSYDLTVTAAGMATLVLPFKVQMLPAGVEAYTLTLRESDHAIMADEVDAIEADQPVLIVADAGKYTFTSELGGDDNISGKGWWTTTAYAEGVLIGNYRPEHDPGITHEESAVTYYHYILQNGADGVGFYQILDDGCTISPYRAYLSTTYNANAGGGRMAPKMRLVFNHKAPTSLDDVQDSVQSTKIIRNGQLIIVRDGKTYNALGQMTK